MSILMGSQSRTLALPIMCEFCRLCPSALPQMTRSVMTIGMKQATLWIPITAPRRASNVIRLWVIVNESSIRFQRLMILPFDEGDQCARRILITKKPAPATSETISIITRSSAHLQRYPHEHRCAASKHRAPSWLVDSRLIHDDMYTFHLACVSAGKDAEIHLIIRSVFCAPLPSPV